MNALYFTAIVAAFAVVNANAIARNKRSISILDEHPIDWYNCAGKPDGNYVHPTDCTRFISCSGGVASERDCPTCNVNPKNCPNGRLIYNKTDNACLWADETGCEVSGEQPSTPGQPPAETTPAPPSQTSPTEPPATQDPENPPKEGDECNPELCRNTGYCQHYLRCDNSSRKLVREECGQELVWNPNGPGSIHGGNCDTWEAIDNKLEARYRSDPECLKCFWKALGPCQAEYEYQAPNLRHRNVRRLSCSDGLVFSQERETCQLKSDVPACGSGSGGNSTAAP